MNILIAFTLNVRERFVVVELNFNKKNRGLKAPNAFPVTTAEDVTKLMSSLDVTRRIVVSKLAEFWEPMGIWEPLNLEI